MKKVVYNEYELATGQKDDQDRRLKQWIYRKPENALDFESMIVDFNMATFGGQKSCWKGELKIFFPKLTYLRRVVRMKE